MADIDTRKSEIVESLNAKAAEQEALVGSLDFKDGGTEISVDQVSEMNRLNAEMTSLKQAYDSIEQIEQIKAWGAEGADSSVAEVLAAGLVEDEVVLKSYGEQFVNSDEFKAMVAAGGPGMESKALAFKSVYEQSPSPTDGSSRSAAHNFRDVDREEIYAGPRRPNWVRDLFPKRTTTANVIEYYQNLGFTINNPISSIKWQETNSSDNGQPTAGDTNFLFRGTVNTNKVLGFATGSAPSDNNAASVAQSLRASTSEDSVFAAAPQSTLAFRADSASVRRLAHWEAVHRNALDDEPMLRQIIDDELMYGLRLVEDQQILFGNGSGENLKGILGGTVTDDGSVFDTSKQVRSLAPNYQYVQGYRWSDGPDSKYAAGFGVQAAANTVTPSGHAAIVGDSKADAIRRAITLATLQYYRPTGVVVHPHDWEDIELQKNSIGTYLVSTSVQMGSEMKVWRIPVIATPAMTQGQALVGSFGLGAQLYDRQMAQIRMSESHGKFFIENALAVLAEQRLALCVKAPESFVRVVFDSQPSVS